MASKSILELDEARRRLEQMDGDHRSIVELVQKLKSLRDSLTSTLDTATSRLRQIEQLAERSGRTDTEMTRSLETCRKQSEMSLASISSVSTSIEAKHTKLMEAAKGDLASLAADICTKQGELRKQCEQWVHDQEERLDQFEERHRADLERVAKAYERAKAALDNHAPLIDGLDSRLDQLSKERDELALSLRKQVTQLSEQVDSNISGVRTAMEASRSALDAQCDEVSRDLASRASNLERSVREKVAVDLKTASDDIRTLRKRVGRIRFVIWTMLLVAMSIAAVYLAEDWQRTLNWWKAVTDYAGRAFAAS